jgi:membrane protease YdiL (CAAX protease family)
MSRALPALALCLALSLTSFTNPLVMSMMPTPPLGLRILRLALIACLDFAILFAFLRLSGVRISQALSNAGLHRPAWPSWLLAVAVFGTGAAVAAVFAGPASFGEPQTLAWNLLLGPVVEEVVFRGVALGVLVLLCGWPFWAAVFAPALFFGLGHWAQAQDLADAAGVFAITAIGGVFFGWLWKAWGYSLWPPILAHVSLNVVWDIFQLGDNAAGGLFGNALRLGLVIAWIGGTIWLQRNTESEPER